VLDHKYSGSYLLPPFPCTLPSVCYTVIYMVRVGVRVGLELV